MDAIEQRQNQYIALFLVILGLCATAVGCHFHWPELTTASAGVWGGGLGLLKGSTGSNSLRAGGAISVTSPDPS
jgi:hypothetical protein